MVQKWRGFPWNATEIGTNWIIMPGWIMAEYVMLHIIITMPEITRLITFRVNKENWSTQPWKLEASSTQVAPRIDGLGGNPIFSNIATGREKPC